MRRPMFSEPLLAHPAEIVGVHATWHPQPGDDDDRDHRDDGADDEQHKDLAAFSSAHNDPDTPHGDCLCACAHRVGVRILDVSLAYLRVEGERGGEAARLSIVHVFAHSRQDHNVLTVIALAIVSTRVPRQNGHVVGRVTASVSSESDIVAMFPSDVRDTTMIRSPLRHAVSLRSAGVP